MVVATESPVQEKPSYTRTPRMVARATDVLAVLMSNGDSLVDDKGRTMHRLQGMMRNPIKGPNAQGLLTNMVKEMETNGVMEREIRGRRTFGIKILSVPDDLERAVREEVEARQKVAAAVPRRLTVVQDAEEDFSLDDAGMGIFNILTRFQTSLERQGDQTSGRLAVALEENQKLRDALHELQEDFAAKSHKVETLTKQNVILQGNLDAAMRRDTTGIVSSKVEGQWNKLMPRDQ